MNSHTFMLMDIYSNKIISIHVNNGIQLCAVCGVRCVVCGTLIHAVCRRAVVCGSTRCYVRLSSSMCEFSVVHAAMCGCPAVRQCAATVW
jgi:hypothetical protein